MATIKYQIETQQPRIVIGTHKDVAARDQAA
jgi:hypothetical protein